MIISLGKIMRLDKLLKKVIELPASLKMNMFYWIRCVLAKMIYKMWDDYKVKIESHSEPL